MLGLPIPGGEGATMTLESVFVNTETHISQRAELASSCTELYDSGSLDESALKVRLGD